MGDVLNSALYLPVGIAVMLALLTASALFSSSETALFSLSHEDLRRFRIGRRRERLVTQLLLQPDRLLTAILFWNLVVNLTYFAVSFVLTQRLIEAGKPGVGASLAIGGLIGIVIGGEVLPKSVAMVFRHQLAPIVVWPLSIAVRIFDPLAPAFQDLTLILRRVFWPHIKREPYLDADDLEQAVENSLLSPEVVERERQLLHNILDLSEITVEEVMRPRGTYATLVAPVHREDLEGIDVSAEYVAVRETPSDSFDRVLALARLTSLPESHIEALAEDIVYVPWCARLSYTLQLLRERICSVAAVVNEFGDTLGIVTYDDILDTVTARQPSRARRLLNREPVLEVDPGCYHVEGITTLRYLAKRIGIPYEPSADGLVTVAGILHEEFEHIPEIGDECHWRGFRIRVIDVSKRGWLRVMMSKAEPESQGT